MYELTVPVVLEACRAAATYQMSIWDALTWAVAKEQRVPYILSADATHGRVLEGVVYVNPFDPEFDARAVGIELPS